MRKGAWTVDEDLFHQKPQETVGVVVPSPPRESGGGAPDASAGESAAKEASPANGDAGAVDAETIVREVLIERAIAADRTEFGALADEHPLDFSALADGHPLILTPPEADDVPSPPGDPEPVQPPGIPQPEPDSDDPKQAMLFGEDELEDLYWWKEHWEGMPDFDQDDLTAWKVVPMHFAGPADFADFAKEYERLFQRRPTLRANWWPPTGPKGSIGSMATKRFVDR